MILFRPVLILAALLPGIGVLGAESAPASYYKEIVPILKRSCTGCHHPGKLKGQLDVTTYAAFKKGGKHGAGFIAGNAKDSIVMDEISGAEPSMPKEGDLLTREEVALFERWIAQGARDDTPPELANPFKISKAPEYKAPPVLSALALSPDGKTMAVSGYHEIILRSGNGKDLVGRLLGESTRIESLAFSPKGDLLAASGGAPARFGEIQIWDVASRKQLKSFKVSEDSVYGVSFSPDASKIALGCADKTVRILDAVTGKELVKLDSHSDWVFCTTFTLDGKRVLTGSRDRAMKLIDAATGQFIDDINKLNEGVLCFARHPSKDEVVYGGDLGTPRIYRISDNQGRTAANNDSNLVRDFERQPGPVHAVCYSPDGSMIAVGSIGDEVRVYKTADGSRVATLKGHDGAVFAALFATDGKTVFTGGLDGLLRSFEIPSGKLISSLIPVPITGAGKMAAAPPASPSK